MFIFPKKVISCINAICISFLWFGVSNSHKPQVVRWNEVCKPKKFGGLDIRDLSVWNQMTICKIAWHIYMMKNFLWVQWVNGVYMKGGYWALFNTPSTASWIMKKLCFIEDTWNH